VSCAWDNHFDSKVDYSLTEEVEAACGGVLQKKNRYCPNTCVAEPPAACPCFNLQRAH